MINIIAFGIIHCACASQHNYNSPKKTQKFRSCKLQNNIIMDIPLCSTFIVKYNGEVFCSTELNLTFSASTASTSSVDILPTIVFEIRDWTKWRKIFYFANHQTNAIEAAHLNVPLSLSTAFAATNPP